MTQERRPSHRYNGVVVLFLCICLYILRHNTHIHTEVDLTLILLVSITDAYINKNCFVE